MPGSVYASAITGTISVDRLPLVTGTSAGLVPAIGTATAAYLKGDLTWSTIAGGGDMTMAVYDSDEDGAISEAQLSLSYATHSNTLDHSVDDVGQHGTATTGVHGVGSGTIAKTADITTHAALIATHGIAGTIAGIADIAINTNLSSGGQYAIANAHVNTNDLSAAQKAGLTAGTQTTLHSHSGGADGETTVMAGSNTVNATTNLAIFTGMSFTADANSLYIIESFLLWNANATTVGIKVSATATNSPTINAGHFITDAANGTPDSSTYNANDVTVTTSASPFTTNNLGQLAGILKTAAGTNSIWSLEFAAETTGTITALAGSVIRYRKVA